MSDDAPDDTDARLQRLLGGDALAALRRRLRRHFERRAPDAPAAPLRLADLSAEEHEALALLTGRRPRPSRSMQFDLADLDARLRDAGLAASLRHALEQLDGPIAHRAAVEAERQARWAGAVAACRHPALVGLLRSAGAVGLLKRLSRQDAEAAVRLLQRAQTVLDRLPAAGLPRAQLAAEVLGNAHALDAGQGVATLVLAAWRQQEADAGAAPSPDRSVSLGDPDDTDASIRPDEPASSQRPETTGDERARDVWARAGVLVNELARPALALNLPAADPHAVAPPGEPGFLSLRRLLRAPPAWAVAGRTVFVCENPNLVAIAADRLGARCAPLVCTDGMPAAAQRTLLAQLARSGARLRVHADFDGPGLGIAGQVMRAFGAEPWRFGAADYEAAAAACAPAPHAGHDDLPALGVEAPWDAALAPAMRRLGRTIAEEAVAVSMLDDLAP